LPSNKLELWAILDSDRVKNPVFRQFYQEREVVKEERRMRTDTNPEGKLYENFIAAAYLAHPYQHPTIGWDSDLDHLSVADLESFYHRFYTPDQLTIAVVGDVKADRVVALVDNYFGDWKMPSVPRPPVTVEPAQPGPRRVSVRFDAQPHIFMGFHIPTYPDPDHFHAFAVAQLLGSGTTSRLHKALVEKLKIATSVGTDADTPGERYNNLLMISAAPRYPHTTDEVERAILAEIERLKTQPIEAWELEKIRAAVNVDVLNTLQTNGGMADTLVYDQCIFGDWKYLLAFQKHINEMTAQQLQQAAQKYLTTQNMTVAVLENNRAEKP
jgi:predicted Zn-dependent peptidase